MGRCLDNGPMSARQGPESATGQTGVDIEASFIQP